MNPAGDASRSHVGPTGSAVGHAACSIGTADEQYDPAIGSLQSIVAGLPNHHGDPADGADTSNDTAAQLMDLAARLGTEPAVTAGATRLVETLLSRGLPLRDDQALGNANACHELDVPPALLRRLAQPVGRDEPSAGMP